MEGREGSGNTGRSKVADLRAVKSSEPCSRADVSKENKENSKNVCLASNGICSLALTQNTPSQRLTNGTKRNGGNREAPFCGKNIPFSRLTSLVNQIVKLLC